VKHYRVDALDLEAECGLMALYVREQTSIFSETLLLRIRYVHVTCVEYVRLGITIVVAALSSGPHQLYTLYKQAKDASLHRFFKGRGAIIDVQQQPLAQKAHTFPIGKEKRLIEAIKRGKCEEAKQLYDEMMEETKQYPLQVVQLTTKHLTVTLENMITEIEKNSSLQLGFDCELVLPKFENYETLEEMSYHFHQLFEKLTSKLSEKRNGKQEELTRRINEIIEERYADPALGLNYIADE